jgi:putative transposase
LRYNGEALDDYHDEPSPYGGALANKWPIRFNPDDVRHVWFQRLDDRKWHRLDWEHKALLDTPFSAEAAAHARRLAAAAGNKLEPAKALAELLERWDRGLVTDRRERRMAARLGAEYAALPLAEISGAQPPAPLTPAELMPVVSDDDDESELEDGFYDDAFEVL